MIGDLLSEVGGRVGHGLVLAWFESYVLRSVSLDSSLQSLRTRETLLYLIYHARPHRSLMRYSSRVSVEEIMADQSLVFENSVNGFMFTRLVF